MLDIFLNIGSYLMEQAVALRPDITLPVPHGSATIVASLKAWNAFIPITEMIWCLGIFVLIIIAFVGFKWIIKLNDIAGNWIPTGG